ncbi:unnamed protein product [Phytophthora fragariaefolia]|uniref:Unnamed protein product n=1 Tax=Phytophthora fragariaefolia TaxID=1490495 RepID=A0A9W6Y1D7_9STRA|nr:unnamed protein product [Phytophthora fragariaefolia]
MKAYTKALNVLRSVAALFKHGDYGAISLATKQHEPVPDYNPTDICGGERSMQDETEELDSSASVDVNEERYEDEGPAGANGNACETQLGPDHQLGTHLGTQLATYSTQLGNPSLDRVDKDDQPELGIGVERLSAESSSATESNEVQVRLINLAGANDEFELESPPKSKGRPKQKAKAAKARRNRNKPTFNSSYQKLTQFKLFTFLNPIAHEISKLPLTKPLLRPEDIVRKFPMNVITKCMAKMTAYQRKHSGVRELDIALEIVGLGVFANSTVALMKKWHAACKTLKKFEKALEWIEKLLFERVNNPSFLVEEDTELPDMLKNILLLSSKVRVAFNICMFESIITQSYIRGSTSTLGVVVDGHVTANQSDTLLAIPVLSNEIVLFPVNCSGNQWCSVMLYLNKRKVFIYDSSASSYLVSLRAVAQKLITLLPIDVRPSPRLHVFEPGLGVQVDNYNCGVYVLLAFEIFLASPIRYVNKQTLQCLRYRYLRVSTQA